jgi:UDP-N-acetylmuramoyl-tripeptide--D-alanyl-D-alanine ligase
MLVSKAAKILSAPFRGEDLPFENLAIDSRLVKKKDLFVALRSENGDGHQYLKDAEKNGATCALVEKWIDCSLSQILVPNTVVALGMLGAWQRKNFPIPLIAITGTCGKTTVKEMLAAILSEMGPTLLSHKSFNNNLGVPLTLWRLNENHQYAVIEVGANHAGEISELTRLLNHQVAIITNAGFGHLEGFGTIADVARAKAEIMQNMDQKGVVILNADDQYFSYWKNLSQGKKIFSFGTKNEALLRAKEIKSEQNGIIFKLVLPSEEISIKLAFLGEHNVANALAAACAAYALSVPAEKIKIGLEKAEPVVGRLNLFSGIFTNEIIDDTYNANPTSLEASIKVLKDRAGEKILVLGDLLELGKDALLYHQKVGVLAKEYKIDALYGTGELTKLAVASFGGKGYFFDTQEELISALKDYLFKNQNQAHVILVKGSRGSKMENIVQALR